MPKKERPVRPNQAGSTTRPTRRPPLGQHFLSDRGVVQKIVESLGLDREDTVLEVGPGRGVMTEHLAARSGKVVAVEIDPRLFEHLKEKFAGEEGSAPRVEIHQCDILKFPIDTVSHPANGRKIKVFGNLPYYITSPCLMHLFHSAQCIDEVVVMVQLEVAHRMIAEPGSPDYGLLSVVCRYHADSELLFRVGPHAFSPPPKVDSAVVKMKIKHGASRLDASDERAFWSLAKAAFAHRRKTLFNNLKGWAAGGRSEERVRAAMESLGTNQSVRAEELSLDQFISLFHELHAKDQATK